MTDTGTDTTATPEETDAFGDPAREEFPVEARKALIAVLTSRFVTRTKQPTVWRALLDHEEEIRGRLDELFLTLEIDRAHEVAFKRQNGEDGVPVLLRREKPLSRDASLLLVLLRQEHAYTDAQDEAVTVTRDHIAEFLGRFQGDSAHDEVRVDRRVRAAIAALERLELLTPGSDDTDIYTVSPAVVPLVGVTELARLEQVFLTAAGAEPELDPADSENSDSDNTHPEEDDA